MPFTKLIMGDGFVVALQHAWGRSRGHEADEEEGTRELGTWESGRSDGLHEVEEVAPLGGGADDEYSASGIHCDGVTVNLYHGGRMPGQSESSLCHALRLCVQRRSHPVETTSPMTTLPARKAHRLSTAAWDLDARAPAGWGRVCARTSEETEPLGSLSVLRVVAR